MEWQIVIALVVAIPIILLPVVFVWFMNAGGVMRALRAKRRETAKATRIPVENETR